MDADHSDHWRSQCDVILYYVITGGAGGADTVLCNPGEEKTLGVTTTAAETVTFYFRCLGADKDKKMQSHNKHYWSRVAKKWVLSIRINIIRCLMYSLLK